MLTRLHSLFVFVYIVVVVIVFASFVDTCSYVHTLIFLLSDLLLVYRSDYISGFFSLAVILLRFSPGTLCGPTSA